MREKITLFGTGKFGKVHAKDPADLNGKPMDGHLHMFIRFWGDEKWLKKLMF